MVGKVGGSGMFNFEDPWGQGDLIREQRNQNSFGDISSDGIDWENIDWGNQRGQQCSVTVDINKGGKNYLTNTEAGLIGLVATGFGFGGLVIGLLFPEVGLFSRLLGGLLGVTAAYGRFAVRPEKDKAELHLKSNSRLVFDLRKLGPGNGKVFATLAEVPVILERIARSDLHVGSIVSGQLQSQGSIDDNCTARLLAVDGKTLYWVGANDKRLLHGQVVDGVLQSQGSIDDNCTARLLAVDGGTFYWVSANDKRLLHGQVVDGILQSQGSIDDNCTARLLAVDGGTFYWVSANDKRLLHGQVVDGVLQSQGSIDDNCTALLLAVDGGTFYWVGANDNRLLHGQVVDGVLQSQGSIDDNCMARLLASKNSSVYWLNWR